MKDYVLASIDGQPVILARDIARNGSDVYYPQAKILDSDWKSAHKILAALGATT